MPQKEIRSLMRHGASLVVSLPAGWVRFYGLVPGDHLEMITNGEVRIRPPKEGEDETRKK